MLSTRSLRGALAALPVTLLMTAASSNATAQTFEPVPALSFTTVSGGANPLPQVVTIASTAAQFLVSATPSTSTGGDWLQVTPSGTECCDTPEAVLVSVNAASLAAGTYNGQIVFAEWSSGTPSMTVPVSLIVAPAGGTYFGDVAGQASFSLVPGGAPPSQTVQIGNGGTGTLKWTVTATTSDGGSWLTVPVKTGTAPSMVSVGISVPQLPGGGSTAGTFVGQLLFKTTGSAVTVPVSVTVGSSVFTQVNPIELTMPAGGSGPLPQVLSIATTGSGFYFSAAAYTGAGGNWLQVTPSGTECCYATEAVTVGIVDAAALAVGTYTGEVVFTEWSHNTMAMTVPVTLTVTEPDTTFFGSMPGEMSFFLTPGETPAAQNLPIRNAGTGTLNWTVSVSTADGGNWIVPSASTGTAPSTISVSIKTALLPGGGATAGTYNGQLVVHSASDVVTVPISAVVGATVFTQVNPINFTMVEGAASPLPQTLAVATTGSGFYFSTTAYTASGGNWLQATPSGTECCYATEAIMASIVDASALSPGIYTGEIVFIEWSGGTMALTVPVTLTVVASGSAFFDNLPGQLSFSLVTGSGDAPPPQSFQVRNAGTGALNWTLSTSTADGGKWLSATPLSGTAPSTVSVSINPTFLPSGAGTFNGQLVLQAAGDVVTIPISVLVGASVFSQLNPLNFTMPANGASPLPQTLAVSTTGSAFYFSAAVYTGAGGNWLTISPSGTECCYAPEAVTVGINGAALAAGTYTGEIVFTEWSGATMSITVPVTLTVESPTSAFFDNMPGQVSFFLVPGGTPPPQTLQVRNAGSGALNWTVTGSTADGGPWLTVSPASGKAPSAATVTLSPQYLPGNGQSAGTFNGQLVFESPGDVVTVPVSVVVGANVFNQMNAISFTMPALGANPLLQILTIPSTGSGFHFSAAASAGNGGSWLKISNSGAECCYTPEAITVSVDGSALSAGTYTGEIVFTEWSGATMAMTVPVTLTVVPCGAYFDNIQGQMSFSFAPTSGNPPSQTVQIRGAGSGTLTWNLSSTTSDGGKWLTVSAAHGTAPATVTIGVKTAFLPGGGLTAGNFTGELVFEASSGSVTVPVSVTVGPNVFSQAPAISFTLAVGGTNPSPETIAVASTGSHFYFSASAAASNGGAWLQISPSGTECCDTPANISASVSASTLPVGTYTGEITFVEWSGQTMAMTVPVTLSVTNPLVPATIAATGGTPQTAAVTKAFADALAATVTDSAGDPVSGVLVTFNAPASGASGTFACSGNTAITNAQGVATSQVFTANTKAGKYTVTATANALTTNPGFALTNKAGPPASIAATAGTPQTATVNTAFATQLAATVKDAHGNPVSGEKVTFNAPASGASGTFAGGVNTATTNAQGVATAPVFTANTVAGGYTVTATVGKFTTNPGFALTNVAGAPGSIAATAGTPQTATVNTAFATNLAATVKDTYGNPVPGATVTFNAPASGASGAFAGGVNTATTDSDGVATVGVFTANGTVGNYTVTAKTGTLTTKPGFALTNQAN